MYFMKQIYQQGIQKSQAAFFKYYIYYIRLCFKNVNKHV